MRRFAIALSLATITQASAFAEPQQAKTTEATLVQLHKEWAQARREGDVAFLEDFYAPEFRIHALNGSVVTRAADIAAFAGRHIRPEIIDNQEMQVTDYGDTAVVTGIEHVRGTAYGQPGEFRLRFTNVFVRRDGKWQLVLHHTTPIRGS